MAAQAKVTALTKDTHKVIQQRGAFSMGIVCNGNDYEVKEVG